MSELFLLCTTHQPNIKSQVVVNDHRLIEALRTDIALRASYVRDMRGVSFEHFTRNYNSFQRNLLEFFKDHPTCDLLIEDSTGCRYPSSWFTPEEHVSTRTRATVRKVTTSMEHVEGVDLSMMSSQKLHAAMYDAGISQSHRQMLFKNLYEAQHRASGEERTVASLELVETNGIGRRVAVFWKEGILTDYVRPLKGADIYTLVVDGKALLCCAWTKISLFPEESGA